MPAVITKEHILDEIRRTAAENGGKPLDSAGFNTATGIRPSDWQGRFWARWSDALVEAGLTPNQMTGAYSRDQLIQLYADLAKELGRLPVKDEVKMKRCRDSAFPCWEPFRRLGDKLARVRAIAEYYKSNPGYETVLKVCEAYLAKSTEHEARAEPGKSDDSLGCVYLLKSGRYFKLGYSNSAGRREYEIGLQLPEKVTAVHVITTDDPSGIEAYWHKRFEAKRKNGEWFDLDRANVAAFKRRRKFM